MDLVDGVTTVPRVSARGDTVVVLDSVPVSSAGWLVRAADSVWVDVRGPMYVVVPRLARGLRLTSITPDCRVVFWDTPVRSGFTVEVDRVVCTVPPVEGVCEVLVRAGVRTPGRDVSVLVDLAWSRRRSYAVTE
ncbi:MAG TPA: hypothetical protein PLG59_01835, partial [bacterium]|nr:hypothetical protein [bacterium]